MDRSGAPEKSGERTAPTIPPQLGRTWKSVSENIVFPKCLVCHNPQGQAKFLDLSNRQAFFANRNRMFGNGAKLINFDKVQESYLLQILINEDEPMPQISSKIPRLSETELTGITQWIELGLP